MKKAEQVEPINTLLLEQEIVKWKNQPSEMTQHCLSFIRQEVKRMENIKVNSVSEAWRTAERIFPTDYEKNEESSKRAGYPIYETTSTDERFSGFHISDLNTRLEVNMGAETVTIWIEEDAFEIIVKGLTEDEKESLKEVIDKEIRRIKYRRHKAETSNLRYVIKNVQKYIRRINYQRKKRGLPNAKYVYVTAYNPDAEIRWHHHIVMDGALDMETVESCWKQSSRNEVRRLQTDENGLSGMANYIVEEKNRVPSEKRWNSSQGLRDPRIKVVHSKRPAAGGSYKKIGSFVDGMVKDRDSIPEILKKWYPDMDFTNANVYYNDFNCMFYIHARMRKRRLQGEKTEKTGKTSKAT